MTPDDLKAIRRHIAALRDNARMADANAALFRPEFDACWEGSDLKALMNPERAHQIRDIIFEQPASAKFKRRVADLIEGLLPKDAS